MFHQNANSWWKQAWKSFLEVRFWKQYEQNFKQNWINVQNDASVKLRYYCKYHILNFVLGFLETEKCDIFKLYIASSIIFRKYILFRGKGYVNIMSLSPKMRNFQRKLKLWNLGYGKTVYIKKTLLHKCDHKLTNVF